MATTKGNIRSDFSHIRHLMREWERVLKETPNDTDSLCVIANELSACATTPTQYLMDRGIDC